MATLQATCCMAPTNPAHAGHAVLLRACLGLVVRGVAHQGDRGVAVEVQEDVIRILHAVHPVEGDHLHPTPLGEELQQPFDVMHVEGEVM